MEWSPIHPSAQGSSSDWVLQWVCRSCGSSTSMQDVPIFDRPTGRVVRFCVSCQLVVPHDCVSPPPQPPVPPAPAPPCDNEPPADWFSHGALSRFTSLYGWGRGDPTPPGSGTQSWLFCPLISHGRALAESRMGVHSFSTAIREQVPSGQSQFWTALALHIIRAYADHSHSLDRHQPAAALLQSWQSGHLDSVAQEVVTPPNIMSMIAVWLSDSVNQFRQGDSSQVLPSASLTPASAPPLPPFPPPPDVPQPCHRRLSFCNFPSPQPIHCCSLSQSASFSFCLSVPTTAPASGNSDLPPPVVAGPFAQHPAPPSVATSPPAPQFNSSFSLQSEFGPPRLTRFLEMPLDRYVNVVTATINDGRFSNIGHGVLRLEGQTAWGVWLRVNHWDSSQGRRARLRVGTLYHVGNRTLTFHGSASTVRQLLLRSFPGLDFCHLGFFPIRFSGW